MCKPHALHDTRGGKLAAYSLIPFRLVIFSMQLEDKDSILHKNKRYVIMEGAFTAATKPLNSICAYASG